VLARLATDPSLRKRKERYGRCAPQVPGRSGRISALRWDHYFAAEGRNFKTEYVYRRITDY